MSKPYFNKRLVERAWTIKESGIYIEFPSFQHALDYVRGYATEKLEVRISCGITPSLAKELRKFAGEGDLFMSEVIRAGLAVVLKKRAKR